MLFFQFAPGRQVPSSFTGVIHTATVEWVQACKQCPPGGFPQAMQNPSGALTGTNRTASIFCHALIHSHVSIVLKSSLELYLVASAAKMGVSSFANLANTQHKKQSRRKESKNNSYRKMMRNKRQHARENHMSTYNKGAIGLAGKQNKIPLPKRCTGLLRDKI